MQRNCSVATLGVTSVQTSVRLLALFPVSLCGIAANALNVVVFLTHRMRRSPINWFLLALSLSDITLHICSILFLVTPAIAAFVGDDYWLLPRNARVFLLSYGYPVAMMTHVASVYYTVLVCVYRYIGVCHPLRARRLATRWSVKMAILTTAIASILLNTCRFWETYIQTCTAYYPNGNEQPRQLEIRLTNLGHNEIYRFAYSTVGFTLLGSLGPFVVLCTLTVLMIRAIARSKQLHNEHTSLSQGSVPTAQPVGGGVVVSDPPHISHTPPPRLRTRLSTVDCGRFMRIETISEEDGGANGDTDHPMRAVKSSKDLVLLGSRLSPTTPARIRTISDAGIPITQTPTWHKRSQIASSTSAVSTTGVFKGETRPREVRVTRMLLVIVIAFLACNIVPLFNNILEIIISRLLLQGGVVVRLYFSSIELGNLMIAVNSASTIGVYLNFSTTYRQTFLRIFWRRQANEQQTMPLVDRVLAAQCRRSLDTYQSSPNPNRLSTDVSNAL